MAKKKKSKDVSPGPAGGGKATEVRVVALPVADVPAVVKQVSDAMLINGFGLRGTFVYLDHLVLVFQ